MILPTDPVGDMPIVCERLNIAHPCRVQGVPLALLPATSGRLLGLFHRGRVVTFPRQASSSSATRCDDQGCALPTAAAAPAARREPSAAGRTTDRRRLASFRPPAHAREDSLLRGALNRRL